MSIHPRNVVSQQHQAALDWSSQHWIKVFPCLPNQKKPATLHGFQDATDDPDKINAWWEEAADYNPAMCPGDNGLCVIDIDPGADPAEVAKFPETYTIRTPRGGKHLYYIGSLPSTASRLAPHIDTRGIGGYVLLPGSVVGGKEYVVERNIPFQSVPDWVAEKLKTRTAPKNAPVGIEFDKPLNIERARKYLEERVAAGDVAVEGSGGDNKTYQIACAIRDFGVSEERAVELIADFYNPHCLPPWSDDELMIKVANAYQYAQNEAGAYAARPAEQTFAGAKIGDLQTSGDLSPFLLTEADVFDLPDPEELVVGLLTKMENVCVFGPSGHGKSMIALDLAYSIAAGLPVFGRLEVIQPGAVVYLSGEGNAGFKRRMKAWRQSRGVPEDRKLPFFFKAAVPNTAEGHEECKRYVEGIRNQIAGNPVVVVIDTMARSMAGLNENDAGDAGLYLKLTETLRSGLGCNVITVAHTGKDETKDIRGSSASRAGFDATWRATMDEHGVITLKPDKLKDGDPADFGPYYLRVKSIAVTGIDPGRSRRNHKGAVLELTTREENRVRAKLDELDVAVDKMLYRVGAIGRTNAFRCHALGELLAGPRPRDQESPEYGEWLKRAEKETRRLREGCKRKSGYFKSRSGLFPGGRGRHGNEYRMYLREDFKPYWDDTSADTPMPEETKPQF